jgi:peptide/nickel transport system substrate-binding protein
MRKRFGRSRIVHLGAAVAIACLLSCAPGASAGSAQLPATLIEPPALTGAVASGELPPIGDRLPEHPAIVTPAELGQYGGDMIMLMASAKDTRIMTVYAYARLVCYDRDYKIVPDILERYEVEDGRVFTFHLRPGHRWSNGKPFTTEDFRYYWEDIANNPDLSPAGPPSQLLVDGEAPKVEILDETTVRYSWSRPNANFLPALAGASPLYIYRPSQYLKKYHAKYADPAELEAAVKDAEQPSWAALHNRRDNMYKNDNPKLPTLDPWVLTTKPPSDRFVFVRNPYYYRVDSAGHQLPYIDRVIFDIADSKIIPAKAGAGEATLQARNIRFDNYTFLKEGEATGDYTVRLWKSGTGSQIALYPNLNTKDTTWRALFRDVRFRRALSLGIDRHEINQVIYYGLAREGGNSVLPESGVYDPAFTTAWSAHNPDYANQLLDELGLGTRDDDGVRLLPDGRMMDIIVETAGESTEEADVLELIKDGWAELGIRLYTKPSQREVFRNRIFAGDSLMAVWQGLDNGIPSVDSSPQELAPTSQMQLQWPKWGQYVETNGEAGEPADMPEAQELATLLEAWEVGSSGEERAALWRRILQIYTDQVFVIGTVSGVPQPVVVSNRLRNLPAVGVFNWDPGAHFGIYKPDTFWLSPEQQATAEP